MFRLRLIEAVRLIAVALVLSGSPYFSADQAAAGEDHAVEPIAFIGHGAMFGPDGSEIAPTTAFIQQTTFWYIGELEKALSTAQRVQFDAFHQSLFKGIAHDPQSALIANTRLIDWLLDRSGRPDVDRIRGKNNLLKVVLQSRLTDQIDVHLPRGAGHYTVNAELMSRIQGLAKLNIPAHRGQMPLELTPNGGDAYKAECAAAGVPLPPDFGPSSAWVNQGVIPKSELFIVRSDDAEVLTWTSQSPEGMCIALPRYKDDKTVEADGVICLGKKTSKACFWDNQVKGSKDPFTFTLGSAQPFARWAGGSDLVGDVGGVCSDCHAGENPYVIHGKVLSSLSATLPTFSDNWYNPIVRTGDTQPWPENPGPMDATPTCSGCHGMAAAAGDAGRLPRLSKALPGYCGKVLRSSLGALAPPLPGQNNAPASMPQGRKAGTLACTPGLQPSDVRYRACSADATFECTPDFSATDDRLKQADFPAAYKVSCTKEISDLLKMCSAAQ